MGRGIQVPISLKWTDGILSSKGFSHTLALEWTDGTSYNWQFPILKRCSKMDRWNPLQQGILPYSRTGMDRWNTLQLATMELRILYLVCDLKVKEQV